MIKRDQRDLIVFVKYTEVIREIGKNASSMKKRTLYEETADYFFLEWQTVGKIIRRVLTGLKSGDMNGVFSDEEQKAIMTIVNKIHSDSDDRGQRNLNGKREAIQNPV